MDRSTALDFANGLEGAARIVTEGTAMHSPEELAGQYAFEAARAGGEGLPVEWPEHLDSLEEAGAVFDRTRALAIAGEFAAGLTYEDTQS